MGDQTQNSKRSVVSSLSWKLMERFGVQGIQFVLQLVLARVLDPEHYGALSLMIIFVNLANIFIQSGFNTALIQNKDTTDDDYSSVFWVSFGITGILYGVIFVCAPLIATLYEMPDVVVPLRVLALMLFPGAIHSVQLAKVSREIDFRKVFTSNVAGILVSGVIGILIAVMGGGLWALVAQTMLNVIVATVVMVFTVRLKIRFFCDWSRIRTLFSFGWKLLASGLIDTLYQDIRSLVIGVKYDSGTLGYYNRGKQFPQFIINAINGAVQSVMLPVLSAKQDEKEQAKSIMRTSMTMSSYIIFPMMAGLAGVATPMVQLLLTDKWLPCVPYLQIYCFTLAFYPVHTCNLQAINAVGRSDVFLKLEIIKKSIGLIALGIAVFCFNSPIAIAMTGVFTTFTSCFINAYPNKKLINYSYFEQMRDILPSFFISAIMLLFVLLVGQLNLPSIVLLLLQIVGGGVVYVILSVLFRLEPFKVLFGVLKGKLFAKK